MKLFVLLLVATVALANPTPQTSVAKNIFGDLIREPPPPESEMKISARLILSRYITQKLDHFDDTNTATWQMRYFSNDKFYVPGGPIFIDVGGEWEISYGWVTGGHMFDMAKEMNGMIFYTEHRYYGESLPTSDASTANLRYLDINQALADLAYFIDVQRETLPGAQNAGVILVGASYSASMVAWFKQAYPDKVNGVWSSSAPLHAKLDFVEYKQVVSDTIKKVGPAACAERIERAIAILETDVNGGDMTRIHNMFNTCTQFAATDSLDVWGFFSSISNRFSGLVQYHQPGQIEAMCDIIMDATVTDDVQALVNYVRGSSTACYDVAYQSFVDYYTNVGWDHGATDGYRQWFYQTCNEFGWYQTSNSDDHIFGSKFPVDLYAQMCADIYDGQFNMQQMEANVAATNSRHNSFAPVVENVFFTHGEYDPWRPMGVQEPLNANTPTVILEGYAHCQDLYSISDSDTEQMRNTKLQVTSYVRQWLGM